MINVSDIIEKYDLNPQIVADQLFTGYARPDMALKRLTDGTGNIKSRQLEALAKLCGCEVSSFYAHDGYKHTSSGNIHTFTRPDDYVVRLNMESGLTQITHLGKEIHELVITDPAILLKDYLEFIDRTILSLPPHTGG